MLAGKYFSSAVVRDKPQAVVVSIAADAPEAAQVPAACWRDIGQLWRKRTRCSGISLRPFPFPPRAGDGVGNDGVEHRRSNAIRMSLAGLTGEDNRRAYGYLLPHEYVHAWNRKYRILHGVLRPDLQARQTTELLWVRTSCGIRFFSTGFLPCRHEWARAKVNRNRVNC